MPVHLDPVAAPQVSDKPVAIDQFQQAMLARDIGEAEHDSAVATTPDEQFRFQKRNRIPASAGNQFPEHGNLFHRQPYIISLRAGTIGPAAHV